VRYRRLFSFWSVDLAAVLKERAIPAAAEQPVVIVGAGPVGVRLAQALHRRDPVQPLVLYGAERWAPYNRVRLSSFLAGELGWDALTRDLAVPDAPPVATRFGCAVVAIDREAQTIFDAAGRVQPYSKLVLATGSTPHVPDIAGIRTAGVYTFRDVDDAQRLVARRVRSRCTVVLGGGLLGLEAARAMRRFHTEVIVVEQADRLMSLQLDAESAQRLRGHVEALGVRVILGDGVRGVAGETRVAGVRLRSGAEIACDTVIVATGIRPNVDLARRAGLAVGRGIQVDDRLRTSDPDVYAAGECAEHRGVVYGLAAPGLEQASVAAADIAGDAARYLGSTLATRLKVLDLPVFSIGRSRDEDRPDLAVRRWHFRARDGGAYARLATERGRLVGAIAVGAVPDVGRLQEAVARGRRVWPWQLWRFARTGSPWPEATPGDVGAWPANVAVCNCTGVTRGELGRAVAEGCATVAALAARTGASTVCGSCRPLLAALAGAGGPAEPARGWRTLAGAGVVALAAALALGLAVAIPYAATVQVPWQWDVVWRDGFWKQVSGFTVLALSVLALVLSLRKRIRRFRAGDFPLWRIAHALLGVATVAVLLVHTGGRLGANLNLALMLAFLGVLALGGAAGGVVALEHRLGARAARLRRTWTWAHLAVFWPVPVLLGMHVLKTYYF